MSEQPKSLVSGVLVAFLTFFGPAYGASTPESCAANDIANAVRGGNLCLALETVRGPAAPDSASSLYVILHGDVSRGGAADYHYLIAQEIVAAHPDAIAVAMLRPGYFDSTGKRSDGHDGGRGDNYTPENIDSMVAAISALRTQYRPSRTVLIGHSGGAASSGVIVGRHPGLVDGVVLVSCPCDLQRARDSAGKRPSRGRSLSPSSFADQVPEDARVIAITGRRDSNTHPWVARDYVEGLAQRGIAAEFREVAESGHNMDRSLRAAILEAVKTFQASPSAAR